MNTKRYLEYHPITGWKQTRNCDEDGYLRRKQSDKNVEYKRKNNPYKP